jgi:hypothetical protein
VSGEVPVWPRHPRLVGSRPYASDQRMECARIVSSRTSAFARARSRCVGPVDAWRIVVIKIRASAPASPMPTGLSATAGTAGNWTSSAVDEQAVGEGSHHVPTNLDVADGDVFAKQRHAQSGSVPARPRHRATLRELVRRGLDIVQMNDPALHHRTTCDRSPVKRHITGRHRTMVRSQAQDLSVDSEDDGVERFAEPGGAASNP